MALFDKISDMARNAGDRAQDAIEMTKLKNRINTEKKEISLEMERLGKILAVKIDAGEIEPDDDMKNILNKVDAHYTTINELQHSLELLMKE